MDTLTEAGIIGWAADDADFSRPLEIDVMVNALRVAGVPCGRFREDLRAAGIGDGGKGFEFDPSAYLKPGRNSLEVRHGGTDQALPKGRGHWVKPRECEGSWERAFIAALEAYWEFSPHQRIYAVGQQEERLERAFHQARLPYGEFTRREKADTVIHLASAVPSPKDLGALLDRANTPGLIALGIAGTPEAASRIRGVFTECGAPDVRLESITPARGLPGLLAFANLGNAASHPPPACPVLAHIHVPKCAGTSFRVLLETYSGPRHVRLYVDDTYFVYGGEALRSYLLQDPAILSLSSHHIRCFPRWVAGREMLYVTFLRDPVEQFVSYMTHFKKLYSTITSPSLLAAVPPDAPHLSLRDFARWLLTNERDIPFRENHNVNFFARHSAPAAVDRLEAAKAALEEFFFVGISERMEESVGKLRVLAQQAGLDFPPGPVPVENTSHDYRDDLSWIHAGDEVGALLLHSVEKDRQLYEWALRRL
ncbi:MAG TPA: hypothetical protein VKR61_25165 [Bryobacteraceae bacterium]|nr:hypothetical protein [Bryobacteraceae bacterium]